MEYKSNGPILNKIVTYPLKGAAGVFVGSCKLLSSGLLGDRQWMLIDTSGKCITQLTTPKLTLVQTKLHSDGVIFWTPDRSPVHCSFNFRNSFQSIGIEMEEGGKSSAVLHETDLHEWFSSFLEIDCRLVHSPEKRDRKVDGGGEPLHFQKAFPLHLTTDASLDEVNSRLVKKVDMNRFRPNLTVSGTDAFEDDKWKRIKIGEVELEIARACDHRCGVPNIEQETGDMGPEPLKTLNGYRRANQGIYFGQNVTVAVPGIIEAGSEVTILEYGEGLTERRTSNPGQ